MSSASSGASLFLLLKLSKIASPQSSSAWFAVVEGTAAGSGAVRAPASSWPSASSDAVGSTQSSFTWLREGNSNAADFPPLLLCSFRSDSEPRLLPTTTPSCAGRSTSFVAVSGFAPPASSSSASALGSWVSSMNAKANSAVGAGNAAPTPVPSAPSLSVMVERFTFVRAALRGFRIFKHPSVALDAAKASRTPRVSPSKSMSHSESARSSRVSLHSQIFPRNSSGSGVRRKMLIHASVAREERPLSLLNKAYLPWTKGLLTSWANLSLFSGSSVGT
mmetsp:Transcript_13707/g.38626  ORF Transcript_13707/g.38626 Transcript_13707/m.38626 type:complete len:277 (-) Transcript_13707:611-1441(-)